MRKHKLENSGLYKDYYKAKVSYPINVWGVSKKDCGILVVAYGGTNLNHAIAVYKGKIYDSNNIAPKIPMTWERYKKYMKRKNNITILVGAYLDFTNKVCRIAKN